MQTPSRTRGLEVALGALLLLIAVLILFAPAAASPRGPSRLAQDRFGGNLSNFEAMNVCGRPVNDFRLVLGGVDPEQVTATYDNERFGQGRVSQEGNETIVTWGPRPDVIVDETQSEHFGVELRPAYFEPEYVRYQWTFDGEVVCELPAVWQIWQFEDRRIVRDVILSRQTEGFPELLLVERRVTMTPREVMLRDLVRDSDLTRRLEPVDDGPRPLLPGEPLIYEFVTEPDTHAVVVAFTVHVEGDDRPILEFFNAARLPVQEVTPTEPAPTETEPTEAPPTATRPTELPPTGTETLVPLRYTAYLPALLRNAAWHVPPVAGVVLRMPGQDLMVGSYAKVPVEIGSGAGLAMDDLTFEVTGSDVGNGVSLSRDSRALARPSDLPAPPSVMLLVGHRPGTFDLLARDRFSNNVEAVGTFTVTDTWQDDRLGPPLWLSGRVPALSELRPESAAAIAQPGGAHLAQTQMITHRIAIILFDTSSQRFAGDTATIQGIRDRWMNEVEHGVTDGSVTRSMQLYFREVSYDALSVDADIFGPYALTGSWNDYFGIWHTHVDPQTLDTTYYWELKQTVPQTLVTTADKDVDYATYDSVLFVSRNVPANAQAGLDERFEWPEAWLGRTNFTTAEGSMRLGWISMPFDWGVNDAREVHETGSHELGHNLGLHDQYKPRLLQPDPVAPARLRNPGTWALMDTEDGLPQPLLAHRWRLGWLPSDWIQDVDFAGATAAVSETYTLSPVERGQPPTGQSAGLRIKRGGDWDYYCEYRRGQTAQIGDRNLNPDGRVVCTDVIWHHKDLPTQRPQILLLRHDTGQDGSVQDVGTDYREAYETKAGPSEELVIETTSITNASADVRVHFGVHGQPDPSIRRWPASPDRPWQSPDILIENELTKKNPGKYENVAWAGHDNTVRATVRNVGHQDAIDVTVEFRYKDFTVTDPPEILFGTVTKTVKEGQAEEFTHAWQPAHGGHYCVVVVILPHSNPVPELSPANNRAQSNYTVLTSKTKSPPSREIVTVKVTNPHDAPARVRLVASQSNPLYRTYIEHRWLELDASEERDVTVMFESMIEDPERVDPDLGPYLESPNDTEIVALIEDPRPLDDPPDGPPFDLGSGVHVRVYTAKATRIDDFRVGDDVLSGRVLEDQAEPAGDPEDPDRTPVSQQPVGSGSVILIVREEAEPGTEAYYDVPLGPDGTFSFAVRPEWRSLQAYYIGGEGYADAEGPVLERVRFAH